MRKPLPSSPFADSPPLAASSRPRLALAALMCLVGITAPMTIRQARAAECAAAAGPTGGAGASALYGELSNTVSAEPLSVDIAARQIGGVCTWVYEVKVLTVAGTVAFLDFDLVDLALKRVEGSPLDPEIARLMDHVNRRGGGSPSAPPGAAAAGGAGDDKDGSGGNGGGSGGSGSGDSGGGDSGGGDSGGGEGGDGGGDGGDGGDGGEGGGDGGGDGGEGGDD